MLLAKSVGFLLCYVIFVFHFWGFSACKKKRTERRKELRQTAGKKLSYLNKFMYGVLKPEKIS